MLKKYDKFFEGYELEAYKLFGSHIKDGGMEFTVWAPHAHKVEVFTSRDRFTCLYPLERIDERGVWQGFIPDMEPIYSYRYRIYKNDTYWIDKFDPYSYRCERRPSTASVMYDLDYYTFSDDAYKKKQTNNYSEKINIYECHLGGFKKYENEFETYRLIKDDLVPYLKDMGYTHLELMPIFEYPFDGSWGYQSLGFFASTSRYGTPYDLMDLINECHKNNIGVILDVVFMHFANDGYGLINYDFEPCYEYREYHLAHSDWGTMCFDLASGPVVSYLMSSANFFIDRYHIDGLRFDAVSHFIYHHGNRDLGENVAGQSFVKRINYHLKDLHPNCMLIAEDSTDFPNVTRKVEDGGLGFDYKWDLGWMNDTLRYYAMDPIYRKYHHNDLTFSMAYFYSERFLLPFSHDEVVHSKKTIVDKMWGTYEDKFKQCRNLYVYMYTHPGKKLNFMGNDIATIREFDENKELDWFLLDYPLHNGFKLLVKELSHMYSEYDTFSKYDYDPTYFKWIDADNAEQSVYIYYRYDEDYCFITLLNNTPNSYTNYQIGVPYAGTYTEVINSEAEKYGGCGQVNSKAIKSKALPFHKLDNSIRLTVAPFAGIVLKTKLKKPTVKKRTKVEGKVKKATSVKKTTSTKTTRAKKEPAPSKKSAVKKATTKTKTKKEA